MSYLKLLSTAIVFAQIAFFGYLPYIWTNIGQNQRIMGLVGSFAGGLFLSLSFLHILPEANEELANAFRGKQLRGAVKQTEPEHQIQWGSLIAMLTFVAVLAIEVYVHKYLDQKEGTDKKKYEEIKVQKEDLQEGEEYHPASHNTHLGSPSSSVILTQLALSIHAFIECLALGSQSTSKATLTLLVGIGCHKWAEGLTLGFQYKRANFAAGLALKFCLLHACLNGGAVILGWIFSQSSELVSGVLGAISAGTFLYVATVEKIQSEFEDKENIGEKIISMLVGIGFVCLII